LNGTLTYSEPTIVSVLTKNGEDILASVVNKNFSFTVDGAIEIIAEFKGASYTVNYTTGLTGGQLKVTDADGEPILSGTELPKNTEILIEAEAEQYYELSTFVVNNSDRLNEFLTIYDGQYWVTLLEDLDVQATFAYPDGVQGATLTGVYYNRTTSVLHAPERSVVKVYNITGGLVSEGTGTLNLSKLSSGNYIAKVKTDNGVYIVRFVKN
ncbi:T9SS type A sorting domain-containing protein, partial [Coprobacter sp.]